MVSFLRVRLLPSTSLGRLRWTRPTVSHRRRRALTRCRFPGVAHHRGSCRFPRSPGPSRNTLRWPHSPRPAWAPPPSAVACWATPNPSQSLRRSPTPRSRCRVLRLALYATKAKAVGRVHLQLLASLAALGTADASEGKAQGVTNCRIPAASPRRFPKYRPCSDHGHHARHGCSRRCWFRPLCRSLEPGCRRRVATRRTLACWEALARRQAASSPTPCPWRGGR
mmetsp:Transcript_111158/g.313668  ORF Transcript_111158/g.313668 Transcript_111158/m.313668 type:complete len:224 (-) Transcript_111158:204-875(-)